MSVFTNPPSAAPEQATAYIRAILDLLGDRDPVEVLGTTANELHQAIDGMNLKFLERASDADLDRVSVHSERGEESARHMARLYAGHDLVHLRQLRRIRAGVSSR